MTQLLADKNIPGYFFQTSASKWLSICKYYGGGPTGATQQRCDLSPSQLISVLLPNILILAGVIFFLLILGGGFMMISGAGKEENAQDKAKAQGAITYGVIGFLLVVSAYFILQIVGTVTGINFLSPTPIP